MQKFIHEIKLEETDKFSKDFNKVSDLFEKSNDKKLSKQEQEDAFNEFVHRKQCLEMGIG